MSTKLLYYKNFSGGYRDAPSDNLKDNEMLGAENIVLLPDGGFENRKGANTKLNPDSYNQEIIEEIEWVVNGVSRSVVLLADLKLYERNTTTGVLTEKQQLGSNTIDYLIIQKNLWIMDGAEIYKWSATDDTIAPIVANTSAENDLTPIKKCTMFTQHPLSLRIFACGNPDDPLALYYSEINDITFFKQTSVLYPQNNEGRITAISSVFDNVVISYNNSWWMWSGIDPTQDARWARLPIPYGCTSHKSIELTPYSFTYLSASGIKAIHASVINQDYLMVQSKDTIKDITTDKIENVIKSIVHPETACAIFYDNKYFLAYGDDETNPKNNKVLVYDWEIKGFTIYTGWQVNSWAKRSDGTLTFASKNYILKAYSGNNDINVDDGTEKPINLFAKTKGFDLSNPLQAKDLWFLYIQTKQIIDTESSVDISVEIDYKTSSFADVSLSESLIWGVTDWGSKWGYSELIERLAEIKEIGSRFSVMFKCNKLNSPITVHAVGFRFRPLKAKTPMISDSYVRRLLT